MILASSLAFFLVIFLLGSIIVAVLWMAFVKMRAEASEAAASEQAGGEEPSPAIELSPLLRTDRLSSITFWDSVLARFDFGAILHSRLEQAELNWTVGRVTSLMLLLGAVAFVVLFKFTSGWIAVAGGLAAGFIPYGVILRKRNKRFLKFRENFPDVLDSLARALRAGYPISASMELIAAETVPPVSVEMRRTAAEANLGRGWPQALENLGKRMPLLEVNMFIAAVQLHSRTGGKLSEVMSGLAENMRESLSLQGEVRALSAHGKLTGLILTILPMGIAAMMMVVSPDYMRVLFNHPWGKNLIGAAVGCLILAHFVIRKIVDIQV